MSKFGYAAALACLVLPFAAEAADLAVRRAPVAAAPVAVAPMAGFMAAVPETYLRAGCPVGPITEAGTARIPNDDCLPPRILPVNNTRSIGWVPVVVHVQPR